VKLARDPNLYTLTSSGTSSEKLQGEDCSDTTDKDYVENEMRQKKYSREHKNTLKPNFY
jgi:hypothetical protein